MKKALLFLNGDPPHLQPDFAQYDLIICTDGAYHYYTVLFSQPCDVVIGDFDSLNDVNNPDRRTQFIHITDQDMTDFDKALAYLASLQITNVDIYGASGKEHDHFISNLSTAAAHQERMTLTFFDDHHCYFIAPKQLVLHKMKGRGISLLPFCSAKKVTTKGLQYPLHDATLSFGQFISIRNVAESDVVEITHLAGTLFVFIAHQRRAR